MAKGGSKRDGKKESKWRGHMTAQAKSGLSVRAYCRGRGIHEHGFHWWRRELARRDGEKTLPPFVQVGISAEQPPVCTLASPSALEIVLRENRMVRVTGKVDRQQLVEVLSAMEAVFRPAEE